MNNGPWWAIALRWAFVLEVMVVMPLLAMWVVVTLHRLKKQQAMALTFLDVLVARNKMKKTIDKLQGSL